MTPMVKQYLAVKEQYPDTILFFRLGDFYEMFFEDAHKASELLDIVLTSREGGKGKRIPMCGVPYHAAQGYINRLTRAGYKVAICEQVEDPKEAKGIVKRDVVRIISPGTNIQDDAQEANEENVLVGYHWKDGIMGLASLNLGTGSFRLTELTTEEDVLGELSRLKPSEVVISEGLAGDAPASRYLHENPEVVINEYDAWFFSGEHAAHLLKEQFKLASLEGLGLRDYSVGTVAAGALIHYLRDNLHDSLDHVKRPAPYASGQYMVLDRKTLKNLELVEPLAGDKGEMTLYAVLNKTVTSLGARLLKQWIKQPLLVPGHINARLEAVEELSQQPALMGDLRERLRAVKDLERILGRLGCKVGSARDLIALKESLRNIPGIKELLSSSQTPLLTGQRECLHELRDLSDLIDRAVVDDPPVSIKDGGIIKRGFHQELDELTAIAHNGKDWLAQLQQREIARTGIRSLKVRYNKVFGYYIEVTKANLDQVPEEYVRRQTLVNAERFIIPELKDYEEKILGAEERSCRMEQEIFEEIRTRVMQRAGDIQQTAEAIAVIDVVSTFAHVARHNNYVRPFLDAGGRIALSGGRHPVVERVLEEGCFVENDTMFDGDEEQLLIITGPNMAGKSTYLRQVALIVLMAQIGSFVPARAAHIGVVDKIFTRIGASDNLARGESTFMVEMIETAHILNNATARSLVILDEIGRGTSTFDGVSIAWAVCEHLGRSAGPRPKTLFATHYHELTALEKTIPGVKNYTVMVKEYEDDVVFIRKIAPGSADRSYGIHVGKLAGLPETVVRRAQDILNDLENGSNNGGPVLKPRPPVEEREPVAPPVIPFSGKTRGRDPAQHHRDLPLFKGMKNSHPLIDEIKEIDIHNLTPLEALNRLNQLRDKARASGGEDEENRQYQ